MKSKGFPVVIAGVIIMLCLGVAYSWGVFIKPIETDLGWSRAQISLAVSILLLVFSVFMSIGGIIEKRIGAANTVTIGAVLMAAAWIGASRAQSPLSLYVFYGVLGGIATGLCYITSVSCGIKWFPRKKGLVTGVIIFGFGFGSAIMSPLITQLIQIIGWRSTMLYCGAAFGTLIFLCARLLKSPTIPLAATPAGAVPEANASNYLAVLNAPVFWVLFFTYFLSMIAGMMTIGHVVAFAADQGFSVMQGALALTVLAVFNGLGRVLAGHLSDRLGGRTILITLFLMIAAGMVLLASSQHIAMFYVVTAMIGLSFGGFLAVYPPLTAEFFGAENFSVNYGLVFIGYGSGCFAGPVLGGIVYDWFHSYSIAFYSAAGFALLGALMVKTLLKRPA